MTSDYEKLLSIREEANAAARRATEAEKLWKDAAYRVAKELKGLEGDGEVRFEKTRFRIECQGTGIYSHETWWEDFSVELLLAEMEKASDLGRAKE